MAEHILAPIKSVDVRDVAACNARASRLRVDGFSGWKRRWLRVLIAVQITCEKLLLVDGAIAARKMIERQKRSWAQQS